MQVEKDIEGETATAWKLNVRLHWKSVCVWTSGALGSNNCILDVSKQSTLRAYWVEPSRFLVKGRFEMCLGLRKPRVFLHHELIVYFITHTFFFFRLCLSLQRWNKQDTYQNHYSQVRKAVTSVCVTFVSLPCPTYWPILPGQVKYVPPAIACPFGSGTDGTFSLQWHQQRMGSLHHCG